MANIGNPKWKKGQRVPGSKQWPKGVSGNPGGKPKGLVAAQTRGLKIISDLAEKVIQDPESQASIEAQMRALVKKDFVKALKEVYMPLGIQIHASQTTDATGKTTHRLTMSQLMDIASESVDVSRLPPVSDDDTQSPQDEG